MRSEFSIKKDGNRGYVVVRLNMPENFHAHVSTLNGCRILINLIDKGVLPRSKYLQESCRRILTDEEYSRLKKPKQSYYNSKNRWR